MHSIEGIVFIGLVISIIALVAFRNREHSVTSGESRDQNLIASSLANAQVEEDSERVDFIMSSAGVDTPRYAGLPSAGTDEDNF